MNNDSILEANTDAAAIVALGAVLGEARANPHPHGRAFVLLPSMDGMKIEYLERPDIPQRKSGAVKVNDVASFIEMVNRNATKPSTVVYGSLHPASFVAVLNDHTRDHGAGWRDLRVLYTLKSSKECEQWHARQRVAMPQEPFATFIEDNLPDFVSPTGARMLEIALNFRANRSISFKSGVRLQDGQVQLEYVEQNASGAGRTGQVTIPELFTIEIPVWDGLGQKTYRFDARLRYRLAEGAVTFSYELARPHKVLEQAFEDILDRIRKGVKDVPIVFGSPE